MKDLINTLKNETAGLKKQYLEMTAEWAIAEFDRINEMNSWSIEKWAKWLNVPVRFVEPKFRQEGYYTFEKGFYNTKAAGTYDRKLNEVRRVVGNGRNAFLLKAMSNAEAHYENSIEKLAYRIQQKELNVEDLKMVTSHIGVNIETTMTDGNKTVRAWTIIAGGPVQRPHYRYLVK